MTASLHQARSVKDAAFQVFSQVAVVNGVGISKINGGYGIKLNLSVAPGPQVRLPDSLQGVPIRWELAGPIAKL